MAQIHKKVVDLMGYKVPVYDQMLTGEVKDIERMSIKASREGWGSYEQDLHTAKILIAYRCGEVLEPPADNEPSPYAPEEIYAAIWELTEPLREDQLKKRRRQNLEELKSLDLPRLQSQLAHTKLIQKTLTDLIREKQRGTRPGNGDN